MKERGCPARVILFYTSGSKAVVDRVCRAFDLVCPDTDFESKRSYGRLERDSGLYKSVVERLKDEGFRVVVNVTPGTKVMSLAAYIGAVRGGADEVFYLGVSDASYSGELLPFVPKSVLEHVVLGDVFGEG